MKGVGGEVRWRKLSLRVTSQGEKTVKKASQYFLGLKTQHNIAIYIVFIFLKYIILHTCNPLLQDFIMDMVTSLPFLGVLGSSSLSSSSSTLSLSPSISWKILHLFIFIHYPT